MVQPEQRPRPHNVWTLGFPIAGVACAWCVALRVVSLLQLDCWALQGGHSFSKMKLQQSQRLHVSAQAQRHMLQVMNVTALDVCSSLQSLMKAGLGFDCLTGLHAPCGLGKLSLFLHQQM